jgi:hypothetical protein
MTRNSQRIIFVLSLTLNFSVIGTVIYHLFRDGHIPGYGHLSGFYSGTNTKNHLSDYFDLSDDKRRVWREKSKEHEQELADSWQEIQGHRGKMIRAIFTAQPDLKIIEAERAEIARLQGVVQRALIQHMLDEQGMLDDRQRQVLAELLIRQNFTPTMDELPRQDTHND